MTYPPVYHQEFLDVLLSIDGTNAPVESKCVTPERNVDKQVGQTIAILCKLGESIDPILHRGFNTQAIRNGSRIRSRVGVTASFIDAISERVSDGCGPSHLVWAVKVL